MKCFAGQLVGSIDCGVGVQDRVRGRTLCATSAAYGGEEESG